jgi:hypothetical protein
VNKEIYAMQGLDPLTFLYVSKVVFNLIPNTLKSPTSTPSLQTMCHLKDDLILSSLKKKKFGHIL